MESKSIMNALKLRESKNISPNIDNLLTKFTNKFILPKTNKPYGMFITIENNGDLRGCIGEFKTTKEIGKLIAKQTLESAFKDSRFFGNNIITKNELPELNYKINFLDKPIKIFPDGKNKDVYQVVKEKLEIPQKNIKPIVGHGITLYFGNINRATYLASVLPDHYNIYTLNKQKWNILVNALKNKSGGSGNVTRVDIYYCQEFSENETLNLI